MGILISFNITLLSTVYRNHLIDNDIHLFLRHLIKKLLVSINQSSNLLYFYYNFFGRAKEANIYEIKLRRLSSQIFKIFFSSFIFKENHGFIEDSNLLEKVLVEKELDGRTVDIDDIRNFEDLPRLVLLDEECGNLKVVNDSGELSRNINQKNKSDVLQPKRCPL